MIKKLLVFVCAVCFCMCSAGQEKESKLSIYGFIRNEFFIDTYKGVDAAYELFYIAPLYAGKDANGKDINRQTSSYLSALATRMGVKIEGPEIFGAKTAGNMEFDFGGIVKTEPTLFRIRHAYVTFLWSRSKLLIGQTWHPFWGGSGTVSVAGLNTGAPFQAFNRSPQLRYDIYAGSFILSGAAVYENQYTSKTMESSVYSSPNQAQRNGVIPELVFSLTYNKSGLELGAGAGMKRIKPRMTTQGTDGVFVADEYLTTFGMMSYFNFKKNQWAITAKGYCGENLSHLTLPGGYGVATKDKLTGAETYTPYSSYSGLVNLVYGRKWQGGLTLGYSGNLGTRNALYDGDGSPQTGGLLTNVHKLGRFATHVALNISKLRLIAEYERTTADYGEGVFDYADGMYEGHHHIANNRFITTLMYFF